MKLRLPLILWLTFVLGRHAWAADAPVTLAPVRVEENPFGSIGISAVAELQIWSSKRSSNGAKLESLVITEVKEGSVAQEKGLRPYDEVVKIDGHPIAELSLQEVFGIWYAKELGEIVRFEIVRRKLKESKTVDLPVQKMRPEKSSPSAEAPKTPPAPPATQAAPGK